MFGNPDFAGSALDTWAGFVTEPEVVTTAVAEVTGEPARPFRDWAAEHADDFRQPPAACRTSLPAEQRADR
jgi:hypothetical protein